MAPSRNKRNATGDRPRSRALADADDIADHIWQMRYRHGDERRIDDSLHGRRGRDRWWHLDTARGQGAAGQNTGQGFVNFVDWSERTGKDDSADAITERANKAYGDDEDDEE